MSIFIDVITQQDLMKAGCFNPSQIIAICERALVDYANGNVIFPDKVSVIFDDKSQNRINCLPAAVLSEKVYGMKWVSVFPENPHNKGLQNISAVVLLSELETGFPIAFMEGTLCSNLRTASIGAIAAKYLANQDSEVIGFIGAGEQAKAHLLTMKSVLPNLKECRISSRTKNTVDKFIYQMSKFLPNMKFVSCEDDYKSAVSSADVIVTAISGQEKILQANWIKNGAFYCHVAGLEDDFEVAIKANKIVCDSWEVVKHRTQTISQMYKQGIITDKDIYSDLYEIILGDKMGREAKNEFIYFNSVGLSFLDIAVSNWMYHQSKQSGCYKSVKIQEKSMFDCNESLIQ